MPVTWKTVFDTLKIVVRLKKPTVAQIDEITSKAFGLSVANLHVLAEALASQSAWIGLAQRDSRFSKACTNKKILEVLKSLFVLSKPKGINFVTFEHVLLSHTSADSGVLSWKRTPHVVRIRKNKIMNWGTLNSNIHSIVTLDAGSDPVLLVPAQDITSDVVFFICDKVRERLEKLIMSSKRVPDLEAILGKFHFWRELYYLAAVNNKEYECFTYAERVPCQAYKLTVADMKKAGFIAMRAGRETY